MSSSINLIGIELEGGWDSAPGGAKGDGSVGGDCYCKGKAGSSCCLYHNKGRDCEDCEGCDNGESCEYSNMYTGELASNARSPKQNIKWLKNHYPDYVDGSCGMHFHVSFNEYWKYQYLASDRKFRKYFGLKLRQLYNHILKRFGEKEAKKLAYRAFEDHYYCRMNWVGVEQLLGKTSERYVAVNFCAYANHGTVEFRILPMFDSPRVSAFAILFLIAAIERYFKKYPHPEEIKIQQTVEFDLLEPVLIEM